jgi:hypothetical protein
MIAIASTGRSMWNSSAPQPLSATQRPETIASSSSAQPITETSKTLPGRR